MTEPTALPVEPVALPMEEAAPTAEESTLQDNQNQEENIDNNVKFDQIMIELNDETAVYSGPKFNESGELLYYIYQSPSGKQIMMTPNLVILDGALPPESGLVESAVMGASEELIDTNAPPPPPMEKKVETTFSQPASSEQPEEDKNSQPEKNEKLANNVIESQLISSSSTNSANSATEKLINSATEKITNNVNEKTTLSLLSDKKADSKSQLEKSTKNYSRNTSNIVWINPFSKDDLSESKKNVLTTTIELAEDDEDDEPLPSIPEEKTSSVSAPAPSSMSGKIVLNADPVSEQPTCVTNSVPPAPLPSEPVVNGDNVKDVTDSKEKRVTRKTNNKKPSVAMTNESNKLENPIVDNKKEDDNKSEGRKVAISIPNLSTDTSVKVNESFKDYSRKNLKRTVEQTAVNSDDKKFIKPSCLKETRTSGDFDEFKKNDLTIRIRIQPEIRSETMKDTLLCHSCGFASRVLEIFTIHLNSCVPSAYPNLLSMTTTDPVSKSKRQRLDDDVSSVSESIEDNKDEHSEDDDPMNSELSEEETRTVNGYSEKDIVWVQTKFGYWPALIMKFLPNNKFDLLLINCPLKQCNIVANVQKIQSFNDAVISKKIVKSCKTHSDFLLRAFHKAEDYSRKRCLGESLDLVKFFNLVDYSNQSSAEGNSVMPSGSGGNGNSNKSLKSDTIQVSEVRIRNYIREGRVDGQLVGIYKGDIPCHRHDNFRQSDPNNNETDNGFGPILDEGFQEDIVEHCSELFKNHFTASDLNLGSYIFSVWAPEAIIKSISRVYHIDMKQAEEIFNNNQD